MASQTISPLCKLGQYVPQTNNPCPKTNLNWGCPNMGGFEGGCFILKHPKHLWDVLQKGDIGNPNIKSMVDLEAL
jgi:hypothetical protein